MTSLYPGDDSERVVTCERINSERSLGKNHTRFEVTLAWNILDVAYKVTAWPNVWTLQLNFFIRGDRSEDKIPVSPHGANDDIVYYWNANRISVIDHCHHDSVWAGVLLIYRVTRRRLGGIGSKNAGIFWRNRMLSLTWILRQIRIFFFEKKTDVWCPLNAFQTDSFHRHIILNDDTRSSYRNLFLEYTLLHYDVNKSNKNSFYCG